MLAPYHRRKRSPRYARDAKLKCNIDVTAFGAVMLVLVFLFLSPSLLFRHHGVAVDLAAVDHPVSMPSANRDDAMIIGITRDGKLFFGNHQVTCNQLPEEIRESLRSGSERKVYIYADHRAKYGNVPQVLDAIRSAGVEQIAFMVERQPAPEVRIARLRERLEYLKEPEREESLRHKARSGELSQHDLKRGLAGLRSEIARAEAELARVEKQAGNESSTH